jgi:hypothetical protein
MFVFFQAPISREDILFTHSRYIQAAYDITIVNQTDQTNFQFMDILGVRWFILCTMQILLPCQDLVKNVANMPGQSRTYSETPNPGPRNSGPLNVRTNLIPDSVGNFVGKI